MLARYIPKLLWKKNSMPVYVTFFVTNKCNLKCQHCFYSAELNQPKQELTLDEIKKMSESMDKFLVLLYSGGEPFLRRDLAEITYQFYRQNDIQYLSIPTNGLLLKNMEEMICKICESCSKLATIINFSIDGLEKTHDAIRGVSNAFNNTINSFKHIFPLKQRYANLSLGFTITLNALNQDEIPELYEYLKTLNPDSIGVNLVRGTPKNPLVKNINLDNYSKIIHKIQDDLMKGVLPGHSPFLMELSKYKYDIINKISRENKYVSPCYASKIACVIYPEGDVYPCELLNTKIGNIRDYDFDFRKLWMSEKNKGISDWIIKSKCFCTHECNVGCNVTFNLKHLGKIGLNSLRDIHRLTRSHK